MQNLGTTIQKLRKEKRLSQTEVAHLLEIPSQSKISSWENGTCIPDVLEAQKLAQIFGVTLAFLLGEG
jgi:transcriptional regulator with XRE-family HTH domain